MKLEDVTAALARGEIVSLPAGSWDKLAKHFKLVAAHDTGLAGKLLLVRWKPPAGRRAGWAIVEEPEPAERVIRPLAGEKEARALIADRLAAYERMWDG